MVEAPSALAFKVANDNEFQKRCLLVGAEIAVDILTEDNTVPNHNTRAEYANSVLRNSRVEAARIALVVVARDQVLAAAADSHNDLVDTALKSKVMGLWNSLAGVFTPE